MRTLLFALVLAGLAVAVTGSPAVAQGKPDRDLPSIVIDEVSKRIIQEWFEEHLGSPELTPGRRGRGRGEGLPPGLAKRQQLPPGLASRGNRLPHGLAKRDLPPGLEARLDPPPEGTERVIVDDDVILIQKGTQIVLDVLKDVIVRGRGR